MKHHFVPRSYLRLFTDPATPAAQEPYLWVADFDRRDVHRRSPANAASLTDYYTVRDAEGRPDQSVEEMFSEVESAAIPVIKAIADGARELSDDQRGALIEFVIVQLGRVPAIRDRLHKFRLDVVEMVNGLMVSDRAGFERTLRASHADREFTDAQVEEVWQFASNRENYEMEVPPEASLRDALLVMEHAEPMLARMNWAFLTSADPHFATGDSPVAVYNPKATGFYGHGLGMGDVEVTFPISPTTTLLGSWHDMPRERTASARQVEAVNTRTAGVAQKMCFCDSRDLAEAMLAMRAQTRP